MANQTDLVRLPFRVSEINEDMLMALNRNFTEIEYYLSQIQTYMNTYVFNDMDELLETLDNLVTEGLEADLPTDLVNRNGRWFYWATDTRKLYLLRPIEPEGGA